MSLERRRQMIEPEHPQLSVVRQCELVSISRSAFSSSNSRLAAVLLLSGRRRQA